MIQSERIKVLKNKETKSAKYVLYWMQAAQRIEYNHALSYAINEANKKNLPLLVCFGISTKFPEANLRHYQFMIEGLRELSAEFKKLGINFIIALEGPYNLAIKLSRNAFITVCDTGYTRVQREWKTLLRAKAFSSVIEVETDVLVPVELASIKEEYSAATIRPKIKKQLEKFLVSLRNEKLKNKKTINHNIKGLDISLDLAKLLSKLKVNKEVGPSLFYKGGQSQALKLLKDFLSKKLAKYAELKNDPSLDYVSNLSPYLHFGQISALHIAMDLN